MACLRWFRFVRVGKTKLTGTHVLAQDRTEDMKRLFKDQLSLVMSGNLLFMFKHAVAGLFGSRIDR